MISPFCAAHTHSAVNSARPHTHIYNASEQAAGVLFEGATRGPPPHAVFACVCVCSDAYVPAVLEVLLHVALGWEPWVRVQKDGGVQIVIRASIPICSARAGFSSQFIFTVATAAKSSDGYDFTAWKTRRRIIAI